MNTNAPPSPVTLLLATRNPRKVDEIRAILGEQFCYLTLNHFPNAPAVVEDAGSFAGNAAKKSVELARWLGASLSGLGHAPPDYVLADDSGLEVDALNGAPGVHSARFAARESGRPGNSPDAENNTRLLRWLKDVPPAKRTARFRCVLALTPVIHGGIENASPVCSADELEAQTQFFDGTCDGRIGFEPRGKSGFGYDPLFLPAGLSQTFAELGEPAKNQISHRSRALARLRAAIQPGTRS